MELREYCKMEKEIFEKPKQVSPIVSLLESRSDSVEKRKQEFLKSFRATYPEHLRR